ncbi:MAG: hypothetical protein ACKV22_29145 [Bryobacteraceae bacterium]
MQLAARILRALILTWTASCLAQTHLVESGTTRFVIVADNQDRFAAGELRRYVQTLTGVTAPIVGIAEASSRPEPVLILIGGPSANPRVRDLVSRIPAVRFDTLKADSFYLWTVTEGRRTHVIAGGNDAISTLYAVYDLIERLGVTFLLTKDVLPAKSSDLALPALQLRIETPFPRRGLLISNIYPSRGIMNLAEVKVMLDQMRKLKLNWVQFFWFEHEPWIDFGYRGETKLLGDATGPETGYLSWRYHYGSNLIRDVEVGKSLFGGRSKMAPMEFQDVETPEEAFRVSKTFLTGIIRYANARSIKVWLCVDPTTLPGNLARLANRAPNLPLPFSAILGTHMCPADPELHEMNENRLRALVDTYPEAEGYFLYVPEMFPDCPDDLNRKLVLANRPRFDAVIDLWKAWYTAYERNPLVVLDSTVSSVHILEKMIEARDRVVPRARVGVGAIGRSFILPVIDKIFPKSIPFTDMESRAIWTSPGVPMHYFGGMGERERTVVPRLDDDSGMFGMQFNVNLYYKDRILQGSVENGVAGFAGQLNRPRGMEQNYRYLAEGAYNPALTPRQFYQGYAKRLFGEAAAAEMVAAFDLLERNEEFMGWAQLGNFGCCGVIPEVSLAYRYYSQPNPFDGPKEWQGFLSVSHERVRQFTRAAANLQRALDRMKAASAKVAPSGGEELRYLINKTESYRLLFQTLAAARGAYLALAEAFHQRARVDRASFVKRLDAAMEQFREARRLGRRTTETFAEVIDHPSDMGVLYRADLFLVRGLQLVVETMENVVNFHHGREYTRPVEWRKIYRDYPRFSDGR